MSKLSDSLRTGDSPSARRPTGAIKSGVRISGGNGALVALTTLFWLIFYQNLPDNWGLNEIAVPGAAGAYVVYTANILDRVLKVSMLAISIGVIAKQLGLAGTLLKYMNPGATAFLAVALTSAVWSIDRSFTVLRFVTLAGTILVCFAIQLTRWDARRFQKLVTPPVMVILIASLIVGALYPERIVEIGTDVSQKDAWHGITFSKNLFGMMASVGVILCLHRWLTREGKMFWSLAGAFAASACLLLSRSNTSLLATLVSVMFLILVIRVPIVRQRFSAHLAIGIAATLILYELVIQDVVPGVNVLLAPITGMFGKDTTLSARTMIWNVIKEHINAAPFLGTGYGAYWTGPTPSSPSFIFTYLMYFYPFESHNGYLEVMNDLGLVGLACLLAFLFYFIRQGLQLMRFDRSQAVLYLALLFQQMVTNMSESEWFARSSTFAILFFATTCMARGLLEYRRQGTQVRPSRGLGAARLRLS